MEENKKIEVMEEFARMLRRSGYPEKFRFEVISDAVRGYQNMVKREEEGGQPVDRPKNFEVEKRRQRKEEKRSRWYRKQQRGTKVREGVIIIPPTPEGALAKALKKACEDELKNSGISLSIQERGGKQLGHVLSTTQPGARKIEHCRRQKCFPCNTGLVGVCRRTGVGYKVVCILCEALISS